MSAAHIENASAKPRTRQAHDRPILHVQQVLSTRTIKSRRVFVG
jgi:hypothetical protein